MESVNTTDPSLEKILISYSEFERLKNIESEYIKLQESKGKTFEFSSSIPSTSQSTFDQKGKGREHNLKRLKNIVRSEDDLSDTDTDIFEHIANLVVKKIKPEEPHSSSLLQVEVSSPKTNPPLTFAQNIRKSDENDSYGTFKPYPFNTLIIIIK
jgi:hypothetical protein